MASSSNTKRSSAFKSDQIPFSSNQKRDLTVRDEKGRQRFHGAFTGGFSAGYFNTAGSVEGFQPKKFISKRHELYSSDNAISATRKPKFVHTPEDYMDDEDFGEFGIAPKRVRVNEDFSRDQVHDFAGFRGAQESTSTIKDTLTHLLKPVNLSVGEILLKKMKYFAHKKRIDLSSEHVSSLETSDDTIVEEISYRIKNDRHGLGYKPLMKQSLDSIISTKDAPLKAVLQGGQTLKISGEAFGVGALDDDEDYATFDTNIYGEDELANYDFGRANEMAHKKKKKSATKNFELIKPGMNDIIEGFVRAKTNPFLEINSHLLNKYPPPVIPPDWQPPSIDVNPFLDESPSKSIISENQPTHFLNFQRTSLIFDIKPVDTVSHSKDTDDPRNRPLKGLLASKFVVSSEKSGLLDQRLKAGLTQYSDLEVPMKLDISAEKDNSENTIKSHTKPLTNVVRLTLEWHPSNILCKRFNVPNPFPNSNIIGLLDSGMSSQPSKLSDNINHEREAVEKEYNLSTPSHITEMDPTMPMDILKSIFDCPQEDSDKSCDNSDAIASISTHPEIISEDIECEIVLTSKSRKLSEFPENDNILPDVEIVGVAKRSEPEVVSILSSSSDDSSDEYGPSLPLELSSLSRCGRATSYSRSSNGVESDEEKSKRDKKKSKKKKRKKDHKEKKKKHKKRDR